MTTTKIAYAIAALVPFGFVILATAFFVRAVYQHRKAELLRTAHA